MRAVCVSPTGNKFRQKSPTLVFRWLFNDVGPCKSTICKSVFMRLIIATSSYFIIKSLIGLLISYLSDSISFEQLSYQFILW
jgi:hypothetical protein